MAKGIANTSTIEEGDRVLINGEVSGISTVVTAGFSRSFIEFAAAPESVKIIGSIE